MACSATKAVHHSGVHVCALRLICPDVQLAMPRFLLVPHSCTPLSVLHCAMLYCMQAAVVSAEQQVSSLEAALQQGSQMTLSMTEKVAQTLAASNTQAETFKVWAGFSPFSR